MEIKADLNHISLNSIQKDMFLPEADSCPFLGIMIKSSIFLDYKLIDFMKSYNQFAFFDIIILKTLEATDDIQT